MGRGCTRFAGCSSAGVQLAAVAVRGVLTHALFGVLVASTCRNIEYNGKLARIAADAFAGETTKYLYVKQLALQLSCAAPLGGVLPPDAGVGAGAGCVDSLAWHRLSPASCGSRVVMKPLPEIPCVR